MTKDKLVIERMLCPSCALKIDEELEELDGISQAKTSYRKQLTKVVYDESRTGLGAIRNAIRSLGYETTGTK